MGFCFYFLFFIYKQISILEKGKSNAGPQVDRYATILTLQNSHHGHIPNKNKNI